MKEIDTLTYKSRLDRTDKLLVLALIIGQKHVRRITLTLSILMRKSIFKY